jgi:hypothetical protein
VGEDSDERREFVHRKSAQTGSSTSYQPFSPFPPRPPCTWTTDTQAIMQFGYSFLSATSMQTQINMSFLGTRGQETRFGAQPTKPNILSTIILSVLQTLLYLTLPSAHPRPIRLSASCSPWSRMSGGSLTSKDLLNQKPYIAIAQITWTRTCTSRSVTGQ